MANVAEMITAKILEQLENGTAPWRKPWRMAGGPKNYLTKKPYQGINRILLSGSCKYWLTFKQAQQLGGTINKGAKASIICFWNYRYTHNNKPISEQQYHILRQAETPGLKATPFLVYYNVFKIDDISGIDFTTEIEEELEVNQQIEQCESIIDQWKDKPRIQFSDLQDRAFYAPIMDYVQVPDIKHFKNADEFYHVLFHELIHSTGHSRRLNRGLDTKLSPFGSADYSKEELIAELGSSFLCADCQIDLDLPNVASYIQSWIKVLKNDPKFIIEAAGKAEKAYQYILQLKLQETELQNT